MKEIFKKNVPGTTEKLQHHTVGIAGCGGLGSNAAVALVRGGIGRLVLADFDRVELSNLNRQYFFLSDVEKLKTVALSDHLRAINPDIKLDSFTKRLSSENVPEVFREADLLIEAFDKAEAKQWLIEIWCSNFPERPIIVGSGVAGLGNTAALQVRQSGKIYFCGDGISDLSEGLCSARVGVAANMQANIALALLADIEKI